MQSARAMFEENQRVDPTEINQVDVEEVAGDDGVGLRRQEISPRWPGSPGSRTYASRGQDLPDSRGSNVMPEPHKLTLDPATPVPFRNASLLVMPRICTH
jgi:hypothetical protein